VLDNSSVIDLESSATVVGNATVQENLTVLILRIGWHTPAAIGAVLELPGGNAVVGTHAFYFLMQRRA
jgi:hypothetical protein